MDTKNGPVWQGPTGLRFRPGRARRPDCGLKSRLGGRKYFFSGPAGGRRKAYSGS